MRKVSYKEKESSYGAAKLSRRGETLTIHLQYNGAYGMGEKFDSLNQKGHHVVNRVEEKFCFQGDKTYNPTPFFWTDTGFGLYVDTCETTEFDFAEDEIRVILPESADIVLFSGTPETILREYMSLFGPAQLPPEWALGIWVSANRWKKQADVEQLLEKLDTYDFPASVVVLEAWSDEATFYIWNGASFVPKADGTPLSLEDFDFSDSPWPDPAQMIRQLHNAGKKLLLWQAPVYKQLEPGEKPNQQNKLDWEEAIKQKLCVCFSDGTPYRIPKGKWFPGSMVPDFTNPAARESWFGKRQYLLDMGVDGFKTDGGEFIGIAPQQKMGHEGFPEDKGTHLRVRLIMQEPVQTVVNCFFLAAGFGIPIHIQRQACHRLGKNTDAGIDRRHLHRGAFIHLLAGCRATHEKAVVASGGSVLGLAPGTE